MRYYLGSVVFGLLMGGLCIVFELHRAAPGLAMIGLFGASGPEGVTGMGADGLPNVALPA
jgi:hypothetical protein